MHLNGKKEIPSLHVTRQKLYQETFIVLVEACGVLRELFGLGKSINRLPKSCPPLMQCRQLQQQLVEMSCDKTSQNFFFGSSKRSAEISILREEAFLITFFFFTKNALLSHSWSRIFYSFILHWAEFLYEIRIKIYTAYLKTRYEICQEVFIFIL